MASQLSDDNGGVGTEWRALTLLSHTSTYLFFYAVVNAGDMMWWFE